MFDCWLFFPTRPFCLMILLAVLIQHITGRFCFIKKTAGTRDLDNRWVTVFVHHLVFIYFMVLPSDNYSIVLCDYCILSCSLTGVICSCWRTCCFRSTFWSGCCWQCGAWSSQPFSTLSTWDEWTSVFLTAMWRRLTQVRRIFCTLYRWCHYLMCWLGQSIRSSSMSSSVKCIY